PEPGSDQPQSPPLGINPLYASPENFQGRISRHCDQYSLAICYQELLTGTLPFAGKHVRQLMMQHLTGEPNLAPLAEADRRLVARALAKDPERRFASCTAFLHALICGKDPSSDGTRRDMAATVSTPLYVRRPPAFQPRPPPTQVAASSTY